MLSKLTFNSSISKQIFLLSWFLFLVFRFALGQNQWVNEVIGLRISMQSGIDDHVISIYPNPVQDKLYVKSYTLLRSINIVIYNVLGDAVQHSTLLCRVAGGEADVSMLPPGFCFIRIIAGSESWQGKFIKE